MPAWLWKMELWEVMRPSRIAIKDGEVFLCYWRYVTPEDAAAGRLSWAALGPYPSDMPVSRLLIGEHLLLLTGADYAVCDPKKPVGPCGASCHAR